MTFVGTVDSGIDSAGLCPFGPAGLTFDGVARSIAFGGVGNQVVFDDIIFGSSRPGGVIAEPATWAMMIAGCGLVGAAARRRRTGTSAA